MYCADDGLCHRCPAGFLIGFDFPLGQGFASFIQVAIIKGCVILLFIWPKFLA